MQVCPVCASSVSPADSICPSCGFKLAGSTQSFKPITFVDPQASNNDQEVHATLRVIRGPQIGTIYTIGDKPKTIGRNPHCDIFLNDMTVSRNHATIMMRGGECVIQDDDSFNGLWVNDRAVALVKLSQGDIVQIGVFCLVYELN